MRQHLLNLLKYAIGIALIVWLFTRLDDPAALWRQIVTANPLLLALGALCYTGAVALSGLKWGVLLRAADMGVPTPRLLRYQWLAEFFNNFLPAQVGGDVMRGYALASDTHRRADAAASVLVDRFIGLLVFMLAALIAAVGLLLFGRPDGSTITGEDLTAMRLIALGSAGVSAPLLVLLLALLSRRVKQWIEAILLRLPLRDRVVPIWQRLAHAFNVYRIHGRALAITATASALIVVLTSINIWLISQAVQPDSIALLDVLVINPMIVLVALLLPLSPGGLGVRQTAFTLTYLLIGADPAIGLAVGTLQQLIGYLVSLPGGYLWVRGRSAPSPAADSVLA